MKKIKSPHLILRELPFIKAIEENDGEIVCVGGIVRDFFLNKESKDLDIMVLKMEMTTLLSLLEKYGKVDLVGESFGIIKFKEFGSKEDIDISLPRKEVSTGERGHKSFIVTTDPFIPIEEELGRRDFTINSIAITMDGTVIDPFDGLMHIHDKIIHYTNADAFFEDPLRMLRGVQFASRFGFEISKLTMQLIQENAERIKEIAPERILIELEKIPTKGEALLGFKILLDTGLFEQIFGAIHDEAVTEQSEFEFRQVRTTGEFIFTLRKAIASPKELASIIWRDQLKGDTKTFKEICALEQMKTFEIMSGSNMMAMCFFKAFKIFPDVIQTTLWSDSKWFSLVIDQFRTGEFPRSFKDLPVSGDDLVAMGFEGVEVGNQLERIVRGIFNGEVKFEREQILEFVSK